VVLFEGGAHQCGEDEDGEELPCVVEGWGNGEADGLVSDLKPDGAILEAGHEIKIATFAQVAFEGMVDLVQQAIALPLDVAAVAGLPGGIFGGQQVPGTSADEFIEDALEDGAFVDGPTAAPGEGGLRQEGLDGLPVLVGQAHGIVEMEKG